MNPSLVEDGVKNFMNTTLNNCYQKKMEVYSWVINITCFIVFFLLLVSILYLFKKPTMTPYEMNEKMQREQEYVVSKIRDYKEMNRSSSRITDLPMA
jgi:F0F1-type ATP synthase membrane subunit a